MENSWKVGDRLQLVFYGELRTGTVIRNQTSSIVFFKFDGENRERWAHADNLIRVNK
jgi:hypothetical protein